MPASCSQAIILCVMSFTNCGPQYRPRADEYRIILPMKLLLSFIKDAANAPTETLKLSLGSRSAGLLGI